MTKKFLIIHVDGLSFFHFQNAIKSGRMPFLANLLENGYRAWPYHSGLPSTTPFAQAGLLYGDNFNIPSFRWYDRKRKAVISFGFKTNFDLVAKDYFKKSKPLLSGGAAIGACYSGGAAETFGVSYREVQLKKLERRREKLHLWIFLLDPRHTVSWLMHGTFHLINLNWLQIKARLQRKPNVPKYIFSHLLEEIFWHKISLFAARQAIRAGLPKIFLGLYAFDELGHAFGPTSRFAQETLQEIDRSIARVYTSIPRKDSYELVVLSDHGQAGTDPYTSLFGQSFGKTLSDLLPRFDIEEHNGRTRESSLSKRGKVILTYSGGLCHLYLSGQKVRLGERHLIQINRELLSRISTLPGVGLLLLRDGKKDILYHYGKRSLLENMTEANLDNLMSHHPHLAQVKEDLQRLNSFPSSGDIIIFGDYKNNKQVNFENQIGSHACFDLEQSTPFILAKKTLIKTNLTSLSELHDLILSKS